MKRFVSVIFAITLMSGGLALAGPISVAEAVKINQAVSSGSFEARAQWGALTYYLQGVVEGAGAYQETLIAKGVTPLFCPPKNKSYSIQEIVEQLEAGLPRKKQEKAVSVILAAYAAQYPCKNSSKGKN